MSEYRIIRANNGAVLQPVLPTDGYTFVYEFDAENLSGLSNFLNEIVYHFIGGTRYSKHRIKISIVHGDKYECPEKDCEICGELKNG